MVLHLWKPLEGEQLLLQGNKIKITDIVQLRNAANNATDFRQPVNLQEQVKLGQSLARSLLKLHGCNLGHCNWLGLDLSAGFMRLFQHVSIACGDRS